MKTTHQGNPQSRVRGLRRRLGLGLAALTLLLPVPASALEVFVSVLPLQTFAERVGGERIQVHTLVQPGHRPATYEPTPRQITALADADLYLRVGVPFEAAWIPRIRATNSDMPVVDLRGGLDLQPQQRHAHATHGGSSPASEPEHEHEAMDAHVWTSPRLARHMAVTIRDALTDLDPAGAEVYATNQAVFDAELAALDAELAAELAPLAGRSFLVYHPAWGYFAAAYGVRQIPIEFEGKEPGARRLVTLIEQARANKARVILVQPQFDQRAAKQVARAIDGRVAVADPLATDYAANLRRLAQLIVDAYAPSPPAAALQGTP